MRQLTALFAKMGNLGKGHGCRAVTATAGDDNDYNEEEEEEDDNGGEVVGGEGGGEGVNCARRSSKCRRWTSASAPSNTTM
jgi:hypothetical protein